MTGRLIRFPLCLIFSLTALLLLNGCVTTMSQAECQTADWYAIGLEDGSVGMPIARLSTHRRQCAEFGVTPHLQAYQGGREEGLSFYCTLNNGLAVGKTGRSYSSVCPTDGQSGFLTGFRLGREIHRVKTDIQRNRSDVADIEREMAVENVSREQVTELRYQVHALDREYGRLQGRLEYLELEEHRVVVTQTRPFAHNSAPLH